MVSVNDSIVPITIVVIVVKSTAVSAMASTAIPFRRRLAAKLRRIRVFNISSMGLSSCMFCYAQYTVPMSQLRYIRVTFLYLSRTVENSAPENTGRCGADLFYDTAILQAHHMVGELGKLQIVRNHNQCLVAYFRGHF